MENQRGNVLFLILIAVALFAALSYAVTSSTRSGQGDASRETRELGTGEINGFISSVQSGIVRIMIGQGLRFYQIQFNNNVYYTHGGTLMPGALGTPANPGPYLFHSGGGGVVPRVFENLSTACSGCPGTMSRPGHVTFHWMSIPNIGSTASDAVMLINFMSQAACLSFNQKNGLSSIPVISFGEQWIPGSTSDSPALTANSGAGLSVANGRNMLCYEQDGSPGAYMLYAVIKEF